jgi:5-(carboxyamino)imidazole ribonucleotide synthase
MKRSRAFPIARLGIIGGGQLGRMLVRKAHQLGCHTTVLDPTPDSPAGQLADHQVVAGFFDRRGIAEVVSASDLSTFELEGIDAAYLCELADAGHRILPDPRLLLTIQDKYLQKRRLSELGLPGAAFERVDQPSPEAFTAFGYPLVQKARRGGYDGKGVVVLRNESDYARHLPVSSILERLVPIHKELAVLVARNPSGQTAVYPVCEMVFVGEANVLDMLVAPAELPAEQMAKARQLAVDCIAALGGTGVFGVEMFLTPSGELLINEISPRTHNSGHYTMEACMTDQFEQHLRAIMDLPLGDTRQYMPAALVNLLGEPGHSGTPAVLGLEEVLALSGVSVHWYGKNHTAPYRKMGHVTVMDPDLSRARQKAMQVKELLRIVAQPSE